ncbi:12234_t:CDS:2, partial [Cetraspora pellucida]
MSLIVHNVVDLVSFEKYPDNEYKYIAHLRDHFTWFSWTCPLHTKKASEVAAFLFSVFTVFGPSYILQSNNKSQGSVKSSNKTLKNALSTWMKDNNRRDWSIGLPIVTYAMNIHCFRPTHYTSYELVFGQHPLCYFNMIKKWKQHNVNMEEGLSE